MTEHYKDILIYIQNLIGDKELAKDYTQEVYTKVLEKKNFKQVENKRAYLYKMAKNLVIDKSRKDKRITYIEYEEENHCISKKEETEEILKKEINDQLLFKSIQNLPKKNKEAFILNIFKGYSRYEIAEIMGISVNAVEKNIARAAIKIQNEIEKTKG